VRPRLSFIPVQVQPALLHIIPPRPQVLPVWPSTRTSLPPAKASLASTEQDTHWPILAPQLSIARAVPVHRPPQAIPNPPNPGWYRCPSFPACSEDFRRPPTSLRRRESRLIPPFAATSYAFSCLSTYLRADVIKPSVCLSSPSASRRSFAPRLFLGAAHRAPHRVILAPEPPKLGAASSRS
jgi:hypothetical protein